MGRRMPTYWLLHNLVRKAQGTKAPSLLGDGHWKGHSSMPAWVYSSSAEDNRFDRCRGTKHKKTEPEKRDGWVWVRRWMTSWKKKRTHLRSKWLPDEDKKLCQVFLTDMLNNWTHWVELVNNNRPKCQWRCLLFESICCLTQSSLKLFHRYVNISNIMRF